MNKWFRRAVGTVGIAGGIWLLGSGTAHADDSVTAAKVPQPLRGLLDDLFTPAGGPSNLGLSLDAPGKRVSAGMVPGGPLAFDRHDGPAGLVLHAPGANASSRDVNLPGKLPGLLGSLPIREVIPTSGLGLPVADRIPAPGAPLPTTGAVDALLPATGGTELVNTESAESGSTAGIPELPLLEALGPQGLLGGLPLPGLGSIAGWPGAGVLADRMPDAAAGDLTDVVPVVRDDAVHVLPPGLGAGQTESTEGLPLVGALPVVGGLPVVGHLLDGGLPIAGNLVPLPGSVAVPLAAGAHRATERPVLDTIVDPPAAASIVDSQLAYGTSEALPLVGSQPADGPGPAGVDELPIFGSLLRQAMAGALPLVGNLPLVGSLPVTGGLLPH